MRTTPSPSRAALILALVASTAACKASPEAAGAPPAASTTSKAAPPSAAAPSAPATTLAVAPSAAAEAPAASLHALTVTDIRGEPLDLASLKGKVVLAVNTASQCGFTPQYAGLERLYRDYADKGFTVVAFPSNDFGGQEPGDRAEIAGFVHDKFEITFPLMDKVNIKAEPIAPIYQFLTGAGPEGTQGPIKWNFTKFLIGKNGEILQRYESRVDPLDPSVKAGVEAALAAQ